MANMFSENSEKQIPKTLSECTKSNATVDNLHLWAYRLEDWGKAFFLVLIVIGILSTIIAAVQMIDINEDAIFTTFITSLVTWALYAFIEYCAFHVLALLISALASITQNTAISANVALYEAAKNAPASEKAPSAAPAPKHSTVDVISKMASNAPASSGVWECKHCLTYNKKEAGFCKECGQPKSKE